MLLNSFTSQPGRISERSRDVLFALPSTSKILFETLCRGIAWKCIWSRCAEGRNAKHARVTLGEMSFTFRWGFAYSSFSSSGDVWDHLICAACCRSTGIERLRKWSLIYILLHLLYKHLSDIVHHNSNSLLDVLEYSRYVWNIAVDNFIMFL